MSKKQPLKTSLVEKRSTEGMYGMVTEAMIIDTDRQGRLLLIDGWGGDDINGLCYRWRQGMAVQLKDTDTFADLDSDWNDCTTTLQAVITGNDPERPILDGWSGHTIEKIAMRHS